MKLLHVVGARPNFPKLAPVYRAAHARGVTQVVVHTGQHYDDALSAAMLRDLDQPEPDHNLAVGSASHAVQTARIMERIEPVLLRERPDWLVVYGDVNSTAAAALVASKLQIRIAHVEAGLRSFDREMPEEINRLVTDRLADLLLTPSRDADEALLEEGEPREEIVFVGNVMVDSLFYARAKTRSAEFEPKVAVEADSVLVTLHRPSNVDDDARLRAVMTSLGVIARDRPVIFPVHPRTQGRLHSLGLEHQGIRLLDPLAYLDMVSVLDRSSAVVTDSGGLQEETTALGIPCFTLRANTERPTTITEGTNRLVPDPHDLPVLVSRASRVRLDCRPEGWDGMAGDRVVSALFGRLQATSTGERFVGSDEPSSVANVA